MSKKREPHHTVPAAQADAEKPLTPSKRVIEEYRRCPICWAGRGGYGRSYSTQGQTRYYRCCKTISEDQAPCGHTWSAKFDVITLDVTSISYKVVHLDGKR